MEIETDAVVMDGVQGALGVISCAPGITNPTQIAKTLLRESTLGLEVGGLIRPCLLCGQGVVAFAKEHNLYKPASIPRKRRERGQKYLEVMKRSRTERSDVQDTVGCMILTDNDLVVAGSSGGNWMRRSGCGGLCSVPGAGVWCDANYGCASSGLGVVAIRCMLARQVCDLLHLHEGDDRKVAIEHLLTTTLVDDMKRMKMTMSELFGVMAIARTSDQSADLFISHTADMFGYGYVVLSSVVDPIPPTFHIELSKREESQICKTNTFHLYVVSFILPLSRPSIHSSSSSSFFTFTSSSSSSPSSSSPSTSSTSPSTSISSSSFFIYTSLIHSIPLHLSTLQYTK